MRDLLLFSSHLADFLLTRKKKAQSKLKRASQKRSMLLAIVLMNCLEYIQKTLDELGQIDHRYLHFKMKMSKKCLKTTFHLMRYSSGYGS